MVLSDISIKNPVFAWMLMAALILFGFICFSRMGLSQMPDVDFPVVNVNITLPGASPEIMETDVADIVEDAVMSVQGIKSVKSTCRQGSADVSVEMNLNRSIDVAVQEIQTKVNQASRLLPKDIDPPVVTKFNPEDQPIVWVAVSADKPPRDVMVYVRDHLKDEFQVLPGVGDVFLGGYLDRNLRIWLDAKKLNARSLTVEDVIGAVAREHVEVPAGRIETAEKEYNLRSMGEAYTVQAFGELPIASRGGSPNYSMMRVKDVATLEDGLDDVRRISRFNGRPAVGLGIRKQRGANAVAVARAVKAKMEAVKKELPPGFHIDMSFDSTRFIEDNIRDLERTILLSALLTGLVCWFFLGSWTSTVNIFLAIPTSVFGTFIVLYFFGFTLNTFTLLGLSLAIGVVVDDAIMVLENIVRRREKGEAQVEAALRGARQITFAAVATTLSIIAIFLPVAFMQGIIGKFFFQFGVTISAAVLLSLLEAITLTPMRCSQFLELPKDNKFNQAVSKRFDRLSKWYSKVLGWCLKNRWKVIGASLLIFVSSLQLTRFLKKEFVPYQDQSMLLIQVKTPIGSSIDYTDQLVKKCEGFLTQRGETKCFYVAVGGFGGGEVNTAVMFVTMKQKGDRPIVSEPLFAPSGWGKESKDAKAAPEKIVARRLGQADFSELCRRELSKISPDLKVTVMDLSMRGWSAGRGFPVEFTVRGPEWEKLAAASEEIQKRMKASGKLVDVDSNYLLGQPEYQVIPNREAAALHGVSMAAIGNVIGSTIGGVRAGKFTEGGHRYDVKVRLKADERQKSADIGELYVRNNRGELVKLSTVVTLEEKRTLQSITREERERAISLYGGPAPGVSQQVALDTAVQIAKEVLPEGYRVELTGTAQSQKESFQQLLFTFALGIIVAYMILGSQFNSFIHPFTVLLALPFSITGAFMGLLIGGQSLNLYSFIGMILLMGLVKKNSIMLVDFTNQMRASGMGVNDGLLKACPIRLRPILMTSIATIAGAIPPALAFGAGSELRAPMAVAVIGGVFVSTILTLVVIPCAYSLLSKWERTPPHSLTTENLESNKKSPLRR